MSLSATGYYRTPKIHWDFANSTGRPFYYFAYGAACTEVVVDTLTGEYNILRCDIIHDVGRSINAAAVMGQVEGSIYMGLGEALMEEQTFRRQVGAALRNLAQQVDRIESDDFDSKLSEGVFQIDFANGSSTNSIFLARYNNTNDLYLQVFNGTNGGGYVRASGALLAHAAGNAL